MAPDHVVWAYDNRAAMVRVIGLAGDPATHFENRVGEPARQSVSLHGLADRVRPGRHPTNADPGPSSDTPYSAEAPMLPRTLLEAITALRDNACFRAAFGDAFVDYFVRLKEFEINRFLAGGDRLGAAGVS